jgi:long-chain acyl-CoA synthetase
MGTLKAGCVIVNTNPLYTPHEMIHQFNDSGAEVVVLIDLFGDKAKEVMAACPKAKKLVLVSLPDFFPALKKLLIQTVLTYVKKQVPPCAVPFDRFTDTLARGARHASSKKTRDYWGALTHSSIAALQYTGGTTGVSKGAVLTHGNLLSNLYQVFEFVRSKVSSGEERILTALPLYHIFAFTVNFLVFFSYGGENILVPSPRPISNLRKVFEKFDITWVTGVNTLYSALMLEDWFTKLNFKNLKASVAGGTALHKSVADKWASLTGTSIVEGYGLTESSPVLTFNPLDGLVKQESIGIPLPSTRIEIRDDAGKVCPLGTPGELAASGPQIMQGYWNRPDETAKVLKDGWLFTGDIATMDADGYFKIVDRKKDMILVSGFNVFPNEVEDCISKHPAVAEVAVIGVPDEHSGESVQAYVVAKDPSVTEEHIRAHCKQFMTAYKIPKKVVFRKDLPKTPVGKILRKDLRKEVLGK